MSIVAADILFKLALLTGVAGNASAQTNPNASLGKYISTTRWGSTTLNGGINASVTSITVSSFAGFPTSGNFYFQVEQEIMEVTAGHGTLNWTVTRGQGGTTAAAHADTSVGEAPARLFDRISGDENAASTVDYRCIFIHNSHATLTLVDPKLWVSSEVAGGASVAIGVDTVAASVIGASSAQALEVANETTAPTGVSFSTPTTKGAGLSLGDIPPGYCKAVWIRRTAANSAALANDGFTLAVEGDTL